VNWPEMLKEVLQPSDQQQTSWTQCGV